MAARSASITAGIFRILIDVLSCHALLVHGSELQGIVARRGMLSLPDMTSTAELRHFRLVRRQSAPDCGEQGGGRSCPNNLCCSDYGWCGDSPEHCDSLYCQSQFGRCGDAPPPPVPTTTSTTSASSSSTSTPTSTAATPPVPSGVFVVSPNGQCGNVTTCAGSSFGDCCSEWYWCGNGPEYCNAGCRSAFGSCGGAVTSTLSTTTSTSSTTRSSTTSLAPPRPSDASTDGRCGVEGGRQRCTDSGYGPCCSDYGWCGEGADYCDVRWCQDAYGSCG